MLSSAQWWSNMLPLCFMLARFFSEWSFNILCKNASPSYLSQRSVQKCKITVYVLLILVRSSYLSSTLLLDFNFLSVLSYWVAFSLNIIKTCLFRWLSGQTEPPIETISWSLQNFSAQEAHPHNHLYERIHILQNMPDNENMIQNWAIVSSLYELCPCNPFPTKFVSHSS